MTVVDITKKRNDAIIAMSEKTLAASRKILQRYVDSVRENTAILAEARVRIDATKALIDQRKHRKVKPG